jgi:hypothetical protein
MLGKTKEANKLLKKTISEKEPSFAHTMQDSSDSERELLARAEGEAKHLITT